ncbi:MAG: HK97 family phage prohead protease [Alphaproteobacteria bacterium]|nr:HK97 family phage prohead protease [Alphaproteobacteria bacterium]
MNENKMNMKYLTSNIEIKSLEKNGEISGYASVFYVVDGYNDVTLKGAFAKDVSKFKNGELNSRPKLLWQHDINAPIGVIEEMYEDEHGLFIKCKLLLEVAKANEVYALLKNGAIDGFSIGYKIRDSYFLNNLRYLTDIELLEISIVTFPACKEAVIKDIKSTNQLIQQQKMINNFNLTYLELIKNTSKKIKILTNNN